MIKLIVTLLAVLIPLTAAALALGAYLNFASVRTSYVDLLGARLETVARRVASDAQVALSMGLPLAGQDALPRLLEREKAADEVILSVDVLSSTGGVLFSSDADRVGETYTPHPAEVFARTGSIVSAFETAEGTVVVRASRAMIDGALSKVGTAIFTAAAIALVFAIIAIVAGVVFTVRALTQRLTGASDGAAVATVGEAGASLIPPQLRQTFASVDEAHASIAARLAEPEGGGR